MRVKSCFYMFAQQSIKQILSVHDIVTKMFLENLLEDSCKAKDQIIFVNLSRALLS